MNNYQDDNRLMSLVDSALAMPDAEREEWLRRECSADEVLMVQVRDYVNAEIEMKQFLQRPFATYFQIAGGPLHSLPFKTSRDDPFSPGETLLDRFLIVRRVAEGGMGIVYEAFDHRLQRRVAIKCAKPGFGNRLPPEVRHAREISHSNVCRIFDIHTAPTAEGEVDFLSMEFLEGQTLAERLRAGPFPASAARAIVRQLCEGLAEAHRNKVVHGDLKTNNVILVPTGPDGPERAVITDFGLARQPGNASEARNMAPLMSAPVGGAPAYMAPELSLGTKPNRGVRRLRSWRSAERDRFRNGFTTVRKMGMGKTAECDRSMPQPRSCTAFHRRRCAGSGCASACGKALGGRRGGGRGDRRVGIRSRNVLAHNGPQRDGAAGASSVPIHGRHGGADGRAVAEYDRRTRQTQGQPADAHPLCRRQRSSRRSAHR